MKIELSHVTDLGGVVDIHLYISNNNYFEKIFNLTKENGRYLVVHARKEKTESNQTFIEGTIYDKNGEICIISNGMFREDDLSKINKWINEHEEEWRNAIE